MAQVDTFCSTTPNSFLLPMGRAKVGKLTGGWRLRIVQVFVNQLPWLNWDNWP
uniref:Uncharacterized protein n=1 Tax=Anguilla anguilla TaxID=7936 RepID=A0A0E9USK2_ANGAN